MATGLLLCALSATAAFRSEIIPDEGTPIHLTHLHALPITFSNAFHNIGGCMRIFVTGATGFIGAHFVERALAEGHEVIGLYRSDGAQASSGDRAVT